MQKSALGFLYAGCIQTGHQFSAPQVCVNPIKCYHFAKGCGVWSLIKMLFLYYRLHLYIDMSNKTANAMSIDGKNNIILRGCLYYIETSCKLYKDQCEYKRWLSNLEKLLEMTIIVLSFLLWATFYPLEIIANIWNSFQIYYYHKVLMVIVYHSFNLLTFVPWLIIHTITWSSYLVMSNFCGGETKICN